MKYDSKVVVVTELLERTPSDAFSTTKSKETEEIPRIEGVWIEAQLQESPEAKEMNEIDKICREYVADLATCLTERMADTPTGYPEDMLEIKDDGEEIYNHVTSPTNIGLYLASIIAMRDMESITPEKAAESIEKILESLERAKKNHGEKTRGLFYGWYDTRTGDPVHLKDGEGKDKPLFLSSVDNAWMATGLIILKNASPEHADRANTILMDMGTGFKLLYDNDAELFYNGYYPETEEPTFGHHYDVLNSETRMVSNVGINVFGIPLANYNKLGKYAPANHEAPAARRRAYLQSYKGSMFEGLLPAQFEKKSSLNKKHRAYIKAQIRHGNRYSNRLFGHSPCQMPDGGYGEAGIARLAMNKESCGIKGDLAITPHAAFLAMWHMPEKAIENLERLRFEFPGMYIKGRGFKDSVNPRTRKIAHAYLALNQEMSIISAFNYLTDGGMARYAAPDLERNQEAFVAHWNND